MLNYKGEKCISCGLEFKDGDDIVVCPVCGTPYHRECYNKEGECINHTLHEQGKSWKPQALEQPSDDKLRCPRCGGLNDPENAFCAHCGTPLEQTADYGERSGQGYNGQGYGGQGYENPGYGGQQNGPQGGFGGMPFGGMFAGSFDPFEYYCRSAGVNPQEQIDGIGIKEYFKYIRGNAMYFIQKFLHFSKEGIKKSFNFPAFFFPHVYFFFRKMYSQAIVYLTLSIISSIFSNWLIMSTISVSNDITYGQLYSALSARMNDPVVFFGVLGVAAVWLITHIISGVFANYWYYKKAKKDVSEILTDPIEFASKDEMMVRKGGTSIFYAMIAYLAATSGVTLIMQLIF